MRVRILISIISTLYFFSYAYSPNDISFLSGSNDIRNIVLAAYDFEETAQANFREAIEKLPTEQEEDIDRLSYLYMYAAKIAHNAEDSKRNKFYAEIASLAALKLIVHAPSEDDFFVGRAIRKTHGKLRNLLPNSQNPAIQGLIRKLIYNYLLPKELRPQHKKRRIKN